MPTRPIISETIKLKFSNSLEFRKFELNEILFEIGKSLVKCTISSQNFLTVAQNFLLVVKWVESEDGSCRNLGPYLIKIIIFYSNWMPEKNSGFQVHISTQIFCIGVFTVSIDCPGNILNCPLYVWKLFGRNFSVQYSLGPKLSCIEVLCYQSIDHEITKIGQEEFYHPWNAHPLCGSYLEMKLPTCTSWTI